MNLDLVIIGAGALGREVYSLVQDINSTFKKITVIGFLDDSAKVGTEIRNVKVIGGSNEIGSIRNVQYVIAIGNPILRKQLFEKVKASGFKLPNLIHPTARIDTYCQINWEKVEGNIICAKVILNCDVDILNNNLINVGCILSHDTKLGNHNTLMQGCIINGVISIGNECLISPGVVVNGKYEFNKAKIKINVENY
jgi:sugar O-acyltransferase (sialic acid O-acetyltransferase NeuD family)